MYKLISTLVVMLVLVVSCMTPIKKQTLIESKDIKAYCIDFNWGDGGPNAFAEPGLWADADPAKHVKWYKDLGVNVIQTFAISSNGYAWYKNGVVPEQPGLKYDFLPEVVRLGHKEGMLVMGYFCVAANTRWGQLHPDESYGTPSDGHIPLTLDYLDYLGNAIEDALVKTGMDGFMIDWLFHGPIHPGKRLKWLPCEQQMWKELMQGEFPGIENISMEQENEFARRSVDRCWEHIRISAKKVKSDCIIWLSCYDLNHPQMVGSKIFKEIDWLMNEAGDIATIRKVQSVIGEDTKLITCLALWNNSDPVEVVPAAQKLGVGLYGFTKPKENSLMPSMKKYLSQPIDSFKGDEKNIATLVRTYNRFPMDYIKDR